MVVVIEAEVELGSLCYIRRPKGKATMTLDGGKKKSISKDRCARECNPPLTLVQSTTLLASFLLNDLPRLPYKFGRKVLIL